jgi:hypothetical protein
MSTEEWNDNYVNLGKFIDEIIFPDEFVKEFILTIWSNGNDTFKSEDSIVKSMEHNLKDHVGYFLKKMNPELWHQTVSLYGGMVSPMLGHNAYDLQNSHAVYLALCPHLQFGDPRTLPISVAYINYKFMEYYGNEDEVLTEKLVKDSALWWLEKVRTDSWKW